MQTVMGNSIQEYCKKINRELTFTGIFSLFLVVLFSAGLSLYIHAKESASRVPIVYTESSRIKDSRVLNLSTASESNKPFGSSKGKTYTFAWCQSSNRILEKNKIYFASEKEAIASGRTLSKLCKK